MRHAHPLGLLLCTLFGASAACSNEAPGEPAEPTGGDESAITTSSLAIDFLPAGEQTTAGGYVNDSGAAYHASVGRGWVRQDSIGTAKHVPLDVSANARRRSGAFDARAATFIHLQLGTPAAYDVDVPNGTYEVTVEVGDGDYFDSQHSINVEHQALIQHFVGKPGVEFDVASATVEVKDGNLTFDAVGGVNTKIGYLTIKPVAPGAKAAPPASPAAHITTGPRSFGLNSGHMWHADHGISADAIAADLQRGGVEVVRAEVNWRFIEHAAPVRGKHTYDFEAVDAMVLTLAAHHRVLQPVLMDSPSWAHKYPGPSAESVEKPEFTGDWAAFAGALAARYGSNGVFWTQHPTVPKVPFRIYEIGNEYNGAWYWGQPAGETTAQFRASSRPATEYAAHYQAAYAALKHVEPSARVIVGGLTGGPSTVPPTTYVKQLYAAAPGLETDGIGNHPYAQDPAASVGLIEDFRAAMNALPQAKALPIYITEVGYSAASPNITTWSSNSFTPTGAAPKGSGSQMTIAAADLKTLVAALVSRRDLNVNQVLVHCAATYEKSADDWATDNEDWMGLWNHNGTRKPTAQAFVDAIHAAGDNR